MVSKLLHHPNLTVKKAFYFGLTAGVGAGVTWLITWLLTEQAGLYYMWSVVVASTIAIAIKFFIIAVWVFNDK